jgi:VanZ family protein
VNSTVQTIFRIRMRLILFCFLIISGIVVVFYFSWIPQPDFRMLWYMPGWLARWCNAHDTLRTAIPFIFLGLFSGIRLADTNSPWQWWFISWLVFILIATLAEAGQLFIPQRVFDWRDIAWGCIGSISGLIAGAVFSFFFKKNAGILTK